MSVSPPSRWAPTPGGRPARYPGHDVMAQAEHWDGATARVVQQRLQPPGPVRFFTAHEYDVACALLDQLLDQRNPPRIPLAAAVDARLADGLTDGWHHADMAPDADVWRSSLAGLDDDATAAHGATFDACTWVQQTALLSALHDLGPKQWRGLRADWLWDLWMRYACTAFYAHPWAWNEIGFGGPAYPRGYKNLGLGAREPWESADAGPRTWTERP